MENLQKEDSETLKRSLVRSSMLLQVINISTEGLKFENLAVTFIQIIDA